MAVAAYALMLIFDAFVLGATAYAVFWLDRSGWWFALAIMIISMNQPKISFKIRKDPTHD